MDPLSVTASVIAIVQLTAKVLSFLTDAKGASTDRERCTLELSNCYSLLIGLQFRLEGRDHNEPWYRSIKALDASNGPFHQYKQALGELQNSITSKSGAARLGQTVIWKLKKEEIANILSRIERLKAIVQVALELDHFKLSQALKTDVSVVQHDTQAIKQDTNALWNAEAKRQRDSLTEWISTSNYPAQHADIMSARQEGTGVWFLKSLEFQNWLSVPRATLFCPGIPGAGKTMISAIAIDHLTTSVQTEDVGVAHIYCNYKVQADQTVAELLAAILKQLVQICPSNARPLKNLYDRHASKKTRPSLDEICQTIQLVAVEFTKVFIVVDALDECLTRERSQERLVAALRQLQATADIRLMFTSRFIANIQSQFTECSTLVVRATEHDVRQFVASRIEFLPKCVQRNNDLRHEIVDKVSEVVDGM